MKKTKQLSLKTITKHQTYYRNFVAGCGAFLVAYLVAATLAPVNNSDASTVHITNNTSDYFIDITSADLLDLNVTASPGGQLAYAADTVNVTTNSQNGYKLYVSTSGNDNNIYQGGDSATASQGYFQPGSGTISSPAALSQNTWGFALNKSQNTSYSSAFANVAEYVNETGAPTTSSTWAAVPTFANSSDAKISELTGASNTPNGTDLDIYYGINASTTLPSGDYSTTITYTAFSEGVNEFPTMQDFTAEQCYNMAENTSINLSDARDDKYYRVTKLADGHCWMTDNLALDGTDKSGNVRILTPNDSNVTTNRPLAVNIDSDTTTVEYNKIKIYSGNADKNTTSCDPVNIYCIETSTKYGNLYSWTAATAGVGKRNSVDLIVESVCPKGWILPNFEGDYSYLNLLSTSGLPTSYTTDGEVVEKLQQPPFNFALAGLYLNNLGAVGKNAHYWTRTKPEDDHANTIGMSTESGVFNPAQLVQPYLTAVRCVFSGQSTDPTMQDFTTTQCNNLATNASTVLVDRRNNQFYRVVHAQDGNCWMADNLNIYGQTISAADSDFTTSSVPSGSYTLPASITATTDWNTSIYDRPMIEVTHGLGTYASSNPKYYGEVYYNWCAATATSGESSINCNTTTAPNTSICPSGWQLPVNGPETTNKSWARLLGSTYGYGITSGTALRENQYLGFDLYYGYWSFSAASERTQGSNGNFWSGTPSSGSDDYCLYYNSSNIDPQNTNDKSSGFSIRCVLR